MSNVNHLHLQAPDNTTHQSQASENTLHSKAVQNMDANGKQAPPAGHMMAHDDPDNPQSWSLLSKIYTSLVAWCFTFALLFAATSYSTGIPMVAMELGVSAEKAIVPYGVFFFGIALAPLYTPHMSEKVGRNPVYYVACFGMALFLIGSGRSTSYASLVATRFFAGLFGGPIVVNVEGTFADLWPATYTGTYYSSLAVSQYLGAATGAVLGGTVVVAQGWRYTQYVSIIIAAAALLFGFGARETYPRQIIRNRARRQGVPANLEPAASGSTFRTAMYLTIIQPVMMLFTEPIVIGIALYLSLNFGVLFQWFVSVPNVLKMLVGFTPKQSGLAFIAAIGGTVLGALSTAALDVVGAKMNHGKMKHGVLSIEHRIWSAVVGSLFLWVSLFWVGFTASPQYSFYIPVVGTAFFVWGSTMQVISFVGYLFDAYPPQATLSALTACAVTRVASAGWFPLIITFDINDLTGEWAFGTFGVIGAVSWLFIPFGLVAFGAKLRNKSGYTRKYHDSFGPALMECQGGEQGCKEMEGSEA